MEMQLVAISMFGWVTKMYRYVYLKGWNWTQFCRSVWSAVQNWEGSCFEKRPARLLNSDDDYWTVYPKQNIPGKKKKDIHKLKYLHCRLVI